MKKFLSVLLFTCQVGVTLAQQPVNPPSSTTTAPAATTTVTPPTATTAVKPAAPPAQRPAPARTAAKPAAPAPRPLTPEEQREKEKRERAAEKERQLRAKWAQEQREYEAKRAEKERQRLAKKAEKEQGKQPRETPKVTQQQDQPTPAATQPTPPQGTEPTPTTEPAPKERASDVVRQYQKEQERAARQAKKERDKQEKLAQQAQRNQPKAAVEAPTTNEPATINEPTRSAPDTVASVRPTKEFLPKGHLFEPILLDPLEAQAFISVLPGYWTEGRPYKGSIVPFEFGFAKPFYRRTTAPGRATEWVLDVASYTQFEVYYDNDRQRQRRQLMNNDYKVSFIYNVLRGNHVWRFRLYHISSHLGDDFIIRNRITTYSNNSVNYEQLDATYSRTVNGWRTYGGLGFVLRKSSERKLLSAQIGTYYRKPTNKATRFVGGVDVKFWQQTDFRPGIHGGLGLEIGRPASGLTFLLEGYSGFRPYSQFEDQQTGWIGVGMYINPF